MKIWISEEEWYPAYELHDMTGEDLGGFREIDLPEDLVERHDKAYEEFNAVNDLLSDAYDRMREDEYEQARIAKKERG